MIKNLRRIELIGIINIKIVFIILTNTHVYAHVNVKFDGPMNFITACDTEHFPWIEGWINSIQKFNKNKKLDLVIFDLGLTDEERGYIFNRGCKVENIEDFEPRIFKKYVVRPDGRLARGYYAWKPIIFKQALKMFDYFFYIDAGIRVKCPSDDIFNIICEYGYFLVTCGHSIDEMLTRTAKQKLNISQNEEHLLQLHGISAGIQGLSKKVYFDYVLPIYNLVKNDFDIFIV